MTLEQTIYIVICALAAEIFLCTWFRDHGYQAGIRDAFLWWTSQGKAIDDAMKERWREQPLSGKDIQETKHPHPFRSQWP